MMGYYGYGNMMGWVGFGLGWIWMLLWWAFVILVIVAILKWLSGNLNNIEKGNNNNALGILKERYAGGEITKEQFEQMKEDIK